MKKKVFKRILTLILTIVFSAGFSPEVLAAEDTRMDVAKAYIDTVLENARYIEGSKYPELFVMGLNSDTLEPVEWISGGKTYYPANFFSQQNFLSTLVGYSNLTGDMKYKEIAKKQMKLWLSELTDKNGLVYTGAHTFVDVKTGQVMTTGDHEMKNNSPYYELMYEVDPEATIKYMEAFWNAHILDWSNLAMNRHGTYDKEMSALWDSEYTDTSIDFAQEGVAFQSTGNDLIEFALFIAERTKDKEKAEKYEQWALRLLKKYIDVQNPETGLSGAQYGELASGDRVWLQFGPEFGDIAKEYNYVDRSAVASIAGYAPMVLLPYYERLSEEDKVEKKYILEYVVKSIEGVAKHVYDAENNRLKVPMFSDGTSLAGYEVQRNGYHGNKGTKLAEYDNVDGPLLSAAVYAYKVSNSGIIWQFARDLAKGANLGDIGTAPGENVELNMSTTARSGELITVMITLYRQTGLKDYITLAEKLGKNILQRETRNNNLFMKNGSRYNAQISDSNARVLLSLEAALQGKYDIIPAGGSGGIDMYYDGYGRITSNNAIFHKTRTAATAVMLEQDSVILPLLRKNDFSDIKGHSAEKDIKALLALGFIDGRGEKTFAPDENITKSELLDYCRRICGEDAEIADANLPQGDDSPINKEELSSILVKTLMHKNVQNVYTPNGALSQFDDSGNISDWARDYADIAANYYLVNDRGEESFSPTHTVKRGEAATALKRLSDLCELGVSELSYTVSPDGATQKKAVYESSNPDIALVDEDGRLFPISVGEAVITATVGTKADSCSISVVPYEEWMLKSILVDGTTIDGFSSVKTKYTHELLIGTTDMPKITATSYSGEKVTVIMPKVLPGTAKIYVGENSDNAYTLSLIPEGIDYVANENFDTFPLQSVPHSVITDKTMWYLHSSGWENGYAPVRIVENPIDAEKYGSSVAIPYKGRLTHFAAMFQNTPYMTGDNATEGSIIVEYDLMTTVPLSGLIVQLIDWGEKNHLIMQQTYTEDSILFGDKNSTKKIGGYVPGEMHNIRMVIDKKTLKTDTYFNGEKVLSAQSPINSTGQIDTLRFHAAADLQAESDAMVYVDNIRIYDLPVEEEAEYTFSSSDGDKITRITSEKEINFTTKLSQEDGEDANVIYTICSPDGVLTKIAIAEAKFDKTSQKLTADINTVDMKDGEYLCVYVWTKKLCPLMKQSYIYKC